MEEATMWACACGHRHFFELEHAGERLGFLNFFDDEHMSLTYGQRIENCPSCGKHLGLLALLAIEPGGRPNTSR